MIDSKPVPSKVILRLAAPVRLAACALLLLCNMACNEPVKKPAQRTLSANTIRIKGSDTMVPLVQRWAEIYMKLNPGISIYVSGGGSGTGINALIEGDTDICAASRSMQPEEVRRLHVKRGSLGISILTAKDALSIYLNPKNPVRSLTMSQLKGILSGEITNWREVGGRNAAIKLINRQPNSGTFLFVKEHVLRAEPYTSSAKTKPNTRGVVSAVMADVDTIGYGGIAYGDQVYHCLIDGVEPTDENVNNGSYPLARYLYFYTATRPEGIMKDFTDWVLSKQGQEVVRDVGYVPLWDMN